MGLPVVTVAAGGMPVVDVTATTPKFGVPVTEATNGRGVAVTKVAGSIPGLPVVFDAGGGGGAVLDGLSNVTAAFSLSRNLLTAFVSAWYVLKNTDKLDTLTNQVSGGAAMTTAISTTQLVTTAGPNNKTCVDMPGDGNLRPVGSIALSNWITASDGYIIAAILPDAFTSNDATVYQNHMLISDTSQNMGMFLKNNNAYHVYNWDGNADAASGTIAPATPYILEWWHTGGSVFGRINGGAPFSAASGNTSDLTGAACWGHVTQLSPDNYDGKIFEVIYFNVTPNSTIRDALVANMRAWIGA